MPHMPGTGAPSPVQNTSIKNSVGSNMNIDVAYAGESLDAAPSYHTLSVEGRSPDDQESSTSNLLKLSVGCADSDEDDYEVGSLSDQLKSWRMQSGPSNPQFENDFDVEIPSDKLKAMISGEEFIFNQNGEHDFAEEVFMAKEPKIYHGYLFGDIIGEGSYAKVKEVVEEHTLVRRAIKIIKNSRVRKIPNGPENVQREMKILRKLKHKNVIDLIETFKNEEKGKLYLVLEFCMGSLQQHIDSSQNSLLVEYEAHMYFTQLISGLEYIHSKGIVHKDIKPGNLLLGTDFSLKISDFGVAEELPLFQPDDTCSIVQGTPKFQAPELVSGNTTTYHGFKSDVWSAGVTLYNMISGLYPFEGEAIMKLFDNIANEPLVMPPNMLVRSWLETLLRGMLNKEPNQRFSIANIKHSYWYNRTFEHKEIAEFVANRQKVYRPLTVCPSLEYLFGLPSFHYQDESMEDVQNFGNMDVNGHEANEGQLIPPPSPPRGLSRSNRRLFGCFGPSRSP